MPSSARAFVVAFGIAVIADASFPWVGSAAGARQERAVRRIGATVVEGAADPILWERVLDLLPSRPARILIVDLDTLLPETRQRVQGLEAFVLAGTDVVCVVRQGPTLRQAERGDGVSRAILASIIWHEMAHLRGMDEAAALRSEQELWRRWRLSGRVDPVIALDYIARLAPIASR